MRWIRSGVELISPIDAKEIISKIEIATRNCYQSADKISEGSGERLIRSCLARGHESPMEHHSITFRVICDRAVSHELVRHRMASYSQESQRYCNYDKEKFGNEITFIYPSWVDDEFLAMVTRGLTLEEGVIENNIKMLTAWGEIHNVCGSTERAYLSMIERGVAPEQARAILPNCTKTDVICTMNLRELRHFIRLRTSPAAHPDIRVIANRLLTILVDAGLGIFFEDINNGGQA